MSKSSAVLVDVDLLIKHAALASVIPTAWARVLATHFGEPEHAWYSAYTRLYKDWDSFWWEFEASGRASLSLWRDERSKLVKAWLNVVKHDIPSITDVQLSEAALGELEQEVGYHCWQALADRKLKRLTGLTMPIVFVSFKTPGALVAGLLKRYVPDVRVVGPVELEQFDITGMTWKKLTGYAGCDPATSSFLTDREMDDWPVVHPPDDWRKLSTLLN